MRKRNWTACLLGIAVAWTAHAGEVVFENPRLRAVLGEDALWRAVVAKDTGKDYCAKGQKTSFAAARVHEKTHPANRATMEDGRARSSPSSSGRMPGKGAGAWAGCIIWHSVSRHLKLNSNGSDVWWTRA